MLEEISITGLKSREFWIPSYQRGYRWTHTEVRALLDDIKEFDTGTHKDAWYCLQPIVVKKQDDGRFELIDGQQRLTTIFIILQSMSEWLSNERRKVGGAEYRLIYETRADSEDFLNKLKVCNDPQPNPDYYFMVDAKKTIETYLKENDSLIESIRNKLMDNTRFIWYEITDSDEKPFMIFRKLNLGKIPLTSAELIKAILLNKKMYKVGSKLEDSFTKSEIEGEIEKQRHERATEWDRIEYSLNEPEFWGFLSNNKLHEKPCMELIFESIARNINQGLGNKFDERSVYFSFHVIYYHLQQFENGKKADETKKIWEDVKQKYSMFKEWFKNDELFHLIGYLLACKPLGKKADWTASLLNDELNIGKKKKSEIFALLVDKIKESVGIKSVDEIDRLDNLDYNENKKQITNILLLFNIVTILSPLYGEERRNQCDIRFPFYIFKEMKWDLEHIRAVQNSKEEGEDTRNGVDNLTLLDSKTNRGYKDKGFAEKRRIIKEKEKQGRFIPICTQNVFNKKYSSHEQSAEDFFAEWNENDGIDYLEEIKATIQTFLFGEVKSNER